MFAGRWAGMQGEQENEFCTGRWTSYSVGVYNILCGVTLQLCRVCQTRCCTRENNGNYMNTELINTWRMIKIANISETDSVSIIRVLIWPTPSWSRSYIYIKPELVVGYKPVGLVVGVRRLMCMTLVPIGQHSGLCEQISHRLSGLT
jgi:hypothetical protein